jgi:CRP-like cAMP-binding protein
MKANPISCNKLVHSLESALEKHLEEVFLPAGMNVYPLDQIDAVYFPLNALVVLHSEGGAKEAARIGNDGMVGSPVLLGTNTPLATNAVVVPGIALKATVSDLHQALDRHPGAELILRRYLYDLYRQILQEAACSQMHTISQRCARWLLDTQARTGREKFTITQEQLAQLLGVRRATINPILGEMRSEGLINYVRGRLTIVNREKLETVSCGCSAVGSRIRPTVVNRRSELPISVSEEGCNGLVDDVIRAS